MLALPVSAPPVLALLVSARPPFKPSATFETEELIRSLTDFTAPASPAGGLRCRGPDWPGSTLLSSLVTLVDVSLVTLVEAVVVELGFSTWCARRCADPAFRSLNVLLAVGESHLVVR